MENVLLQRTELRFTAVHPKEKTPSRDALRAELAKAMKTQKDNVILDWMRSMYGTYRSVGYAKIYKSKDVALRTERKPILVRNGLLAREIKEEKPKAGAPPKKAPEKKEAPKPAEKKAEAPAKPPKEGKPHTEKPSTHPEAKKAQKGEK